MDIFALGAIAGGLIGLIYTVALIGSEIRNELSGIRRALEKK